MHEFAVKPALEGTLDMFTGVMGKPVDGVAWTIEQLGQRMLDSADRLESTAKQDL